jgi:DNA processing protein
VYPAEHRTLSDAIAAAGTLIAEGVPGTPPRRDHFPRRNRLISGLSLGVVVVEASARSGSLITARLALDQGREVMAVPGPVTGERHRGAHALIRDGGALVESAADVFAVLGIDQSVRSSRARAGTSAEPADPPMLDRMSPGETYELQHLLELTGLQAPDVLRSLLDLELTGLVMRLPGGRFFRPARRPPRIEVVR